MTRFLAEAEYIIDSSARWKASDLKISDVTENPNASIEGLQNVSQNHRVRLFGSSLARQLTRFFLFRLSFELLHSFEL
jgi:hypothetical protein